MTLLEVYHDDRLRDSEAFVATYSTRTQTSNMAVTTHNGRTSLSQWEDIVGRKVDTLFLHRSEAYQPRYYNLARAECGLGKPDRMHRRAFADCAAIFSAASSTSLTLSWNEAQVHAQTAAVRERVAPGTSLWRSTNAHQRRTARESPGKNAAHEHKRRTMSWTLKRCN